MAFDIMSMFSPQAINRLLQPIQSAQDVQQLGPGLVDRNRMASAMQPANDPWEGMRQATVDPMQTAAVPQQPAPMQQAAPAPSAPQRQPFFNDERKAMLNDIFTGWAMGSTPGESIAMGAKMVAANRGTRKNVNETVDWLKGRGMDEGQAKMLAGSPPALNEYLKQMLNPEKPKPLEVNGRLVDPNTFQVLADFSAPKEAKDDRTATMKELEAAGLKPGTPEYEQALLANNRPKGMMIESDGQGGFRMVQGADVSGGANLNVEQGKNTGFLLRANDANKVITSLESEGTSAWNKMAGGIPGVGNYLVGEGAQKLTQSKRDFINAVLRQESGAVISPEEFANAEQQYFPQPGDGPEVIAQKRQNRENAIAGFKIRSGPGAASVEQMQGQKDQPGGIVDYRQYFGGQ